MYLVSYVILIVLMARFLYDSNEREVPIFIRIIGASFYGFLMAVISMDFYQKFDILKWFYRHQ